MTSPKHASTEKQAKLLTAANEVAKNITSILERGEILRRAVDIICQQFGFYYAGVFLVEENGFYAKLHAGYGEAGINQLKEGYKLEIGGESPVVKAIQTREIHLVNGVESDPQPFIYPHLPNTRSELVIPLVLRNHSIGALTVHSTEDEAFTQEGITTLQGIADQLAITLENARLAEINDHLLSQANRRSRLLYAANEVGYKLSSILDLNLLLPITVDVICDTYGFYYSGVFLVDPSGSTARLVAGRGEAGQAQIEQGHELAIDNSSMIGAAIGQKKAHIVHDINNEDTYTKNPYLPNTRSEMALPLIVGDLVLGAVTVQSEEPSAFSTDDITTLQTMADHLAIAIYNAKLLRELDFTNEALLRSKTYEALATATSQAIHWIGNKAFPITSATERMKQDLLDGNPDTESLLEDLDMISQSARLIGEVKDALLGPRRDQNLRASLIADVVQAAAFHLGIGEDVLAINTAPETPFAMTDTTQLARVLTSLFKNSLEAGATHISANITPTLDEGFVAISIADDGLGIPEEVKDQIWTTFFTTKGPDHHGLGLASVLHLLSQMGGRITVDSQPEQGATFTIVLPTAPDDEAIDLSSAPENILFIDEEDDTWALFAANVLKLAGKNVVVQGTPAGAIEADLILVDEALTTMKVTDVIAALSEAGLAHKAVIVTAVLDPDRAIKYMSAGVRDVALKPYTYSSLASFLNYEVDQDKEELQADE